MYRHCIFCSADLKGNEALERFPVGRSVAFDGEKGRLWAVCPRCARWNLAPLEERWEALEDAERAFRDARLRVHRENVGLARLSDGTRLVRVGAALPGELAVWRYGESLLRRRTRALALGAVGIAAAAGVYVAGVATAGLTLGGANLLVQGGRRVWRGLAERRTVVRLLPGETGDGLPAVLRQRAIAGAELGRGSDGELQLRLAGLREDWVPYAQGIMRAQPRDLVVHGPAARRALARIMVRVNARGARRDTLNGAVDTLSHSRSASEYLMRTAQLGYRFGSARSTPTHDLALEMALHEETERRAMEGELAGLEEMWRQAEEVAAIADRLPDALDPEGRTRT